jgi:hypothetical protein
MSELPTFLTEQQLQQFLGLGAQELDQIAQWGLFKNSVEPGYRGDRVRDWIDVSAQFPGVFLQEKFAAALLGLPVAELHRRMDVFRSAKTTFDNQLYWKHRLDSIYRRNLAPDSIHGGLNDSHEEFAAKVKVRLAPCIVCGEKAVYTVCNKCGELVDPAHCEAVNEERPLRFRPAEVCFNCIRDFGLKEFDFFRDRRSVRTSVERVLGPLPAR